MKSNNIWKIVIGAVSAALGYILNAMWITRFKKFYEFQEALFLLIFQHFY